VFLGVFNVKEKQVFEAYKEYIINTKYRFVESVIFGILALLCLIAATKPVFIVTNVLLIIWSAFDIYLYVSNNYFKSSSK